MPNIDTAYQFLVLAGNTSGTNGQIQIIGPSTTLTFGNSTANASVNSSTILIKDVNGMVSVNTTTSQIGGPSNTSNVFIGYITLPSGVIMNYGGTNANSTGTTITLGLPFASSPFSIGADSNTVASTVAVVQANTTKITIQSNTTTNVFCYWQAWGQ